MTKFKILLKQKITGDLLEIVNEIFNPNNGIAFFEIERDKWEVVLARQYVTTLKGIDLYEEDRVMVKGKKSVGLYETKIIKDNQGWTLKENKTYLNNDTCFIAIKEKI